MRNTNPLLWTALTVLPCVSQTFQAGSNGSDGALELNIPGIVVFDPKSFNPPLNPAADNVYHFRSIHIGKDVTVKLSSRTLAGPVFWLSEGPVIIEGTIDLSGDDGGRGPSVAGAGGFPGGAVRMPGYGPGASFRHNEFLVPLVGGRGGDGGERQGAGAGGGALLLASSTSITIDGWITANGGDSVDGTGGSGGAIRLVAPAIGGGGGLEAKGGKQSGTDGRIRLEAADQRFTGRIMGGSVSIGKPFGLFLPPSGPPSVRVVSAGGAPVESSELRLNLSIPVLLIVESRNVPPGTVVSLEFYTNEGLVKTVKTTPLDGTFERSHARAEVTLPRGATECYVKGMWPR